jgi:hypothetical protein
VSLTTWETGPAPTALPGEAVVRLPPIEEIALRWREAEPLIAKATRRTGCYEPIDLLALAIAGKFGIWFCEAEPGRLDAVIVTEVATYPRRRVLEVLFAGGGNMRAWIGPAVAAIDRHARELGCSHVAGMGRAGWVRAWGARSTGDVIMVRELQQNV